MLSSRWARSLRIVLVLSAAMLVAAMALPAHAATLTQTWAERYVGGTDFQYGQSLAVSPDGATVYVTGISAGPVNEGDPYDAFATIAYDAATGETKWLDRFSYAEIDNWASAVVVSPDGRQVYVTGLTPIGYPIVAYDAITGHRLWVSHAPKDSGVGSEGELTVSPDSRRVFFTGEVVVGDGPQSQLVTMAFRAGTGATIWSNTFARPDGQIRPAAITLDPRGRHLFVTGATGDLNQYPTPDPPDFATVAYQARSGARLWTKLYDGPAGGADNAQALAVTPDGRSLIVGGTSGTATGTWQFAVIAYRAGTGNVAWVSRSGSAAIHRSLQAMTIDRSGRAVYVTGEDSALDWSWQRYRTTSLSVSAGTIGWSKSYGTGLTANAAAIAMSPNDALVYVTGGTDTAALHFYTSYATVAYSAATGERVASARYTPSPTPSAQAESIGVSPSGEIFVTGRGGGAFATVAYALT